MDFGVCHLLTVKKILYTSFGTPLSDADASLTMETSNISKPEYGWGVLISRIKMPLFQFLQEPELRNFSEKLPALKEMSKMFFVWRWKFDKVL